MCIRDSSWGTGNPPGNMADGLLSTVSLKPTATCGTVAMTLAETQLVDINGSIIALTAQNGGSVAVFSKFDINGSSSICLLYTSYAADERSSVDLGGGRIIKKKKEEKNRKKTNDKKKRREKQ